MMIERSEKRVLVIGLDGATFDLIEPWVAQGYLPNLAGLLTEGCTGQLASTIQPTTAPAWVTFMTGVNQGKHGLYDFVRRRPDSYNLEITNASTVAAPTIFEILSQQGRRVVTLNIPYTFPPRAVNGISIGGPFAPSVSRELVWPPSYYDVLQKLAPDYFVLPDYDARAADPMTDYANKLLKGVELRERMSLHLLQTEPWDLFMVVFMATDEVQHTYWHCLEAAEDTPAARHRHTIRNVYQRIDQAIGAMQEQIAHDKDGRDTVVIIVSDHGAGPFQLMINLNRWLAESGYLQFRGNSRGIFRSLQVEAMKGLASAYRRYLPAAVRAAIRAKMGSSHFNQMKEEFESALLTLNVVWDRTLAYALGAGGNIYLNVKGREPLGVVSPGTEYESVRQKLSEALMTMAHPETGAPLIERVYHREELYNGHMLEQAPDLIIQWKDYGYWGRGQYDSRSPVFEAQRRLDFSEQPLTGSHRLEGILITKGPHISAGTRIEGAHLLDLAPTILSLLNIAPPVEMDGHVLTDIVPPEQLERLAQTGDYVTMPTGDFAYSSEEAESVAEHLRALGYL